MTVAPGTVVKDLDVVKNIGPGHVSGFIDAFADTLFLQATDEGFRHSIDAPMSTRVR